MGSTSLGMRTLEGGYDAVRAVDKEHSKSKDEGESGTAATALGSDNEPNILFMILFCS